MTTNPLANQLATMRNERVTDVGQPSFGDIGGNRLGTKINARSDQLAREKSGRSLGYFGVRGGSITAGAGNSALESFRTKHSRPNVRETFQNFEVGTNDIIALNRNVMQFNKRFDGVAPYELAILHHSGERELDSNLIRNDVDMMVECAALEIMAPQLFNYIETRRQAHMFHHDREAYQRLSPSEVWAAYSFDGIVESEAKSKGDGGFLFSPVNKDGVGDGKVAPLLAVGGECGSKRVTIDTEGGQFMINYFGSNIFPGGKLYAVLKKFLAPLDFRLSQQGTTEKLVTELVAQQMKSFRPILMAFFCIPDGGPVPDEARHYIDDDGNNMNDALVIELGTVFSVPPDHRYLPLDLAHLQPYNGKLTTRTESTMLMKVLYNTRNGLLFV